MFSIVLTATWRDWPSLLTAAASQWHATLYCNPILTTMLWIQHNSGFMAIKTCFLIIQDTSQCGYAEAKKNSWGERGSDTVQFPGPQGSPQSQSIWTQSFTGPRGTYTLRCQHQFWKLKPRHIKNLPTAQTGISSALQIMCMPGQTCLLKLHFPLWGVDISNSPSALSKLLHGILPFTRGSQRGRGRKQ